MISLSCSLFDLVIDLVIGCCSCLVPLSLFALTLQHIEHPFQAVTVTEAFFFGFLSQSPSCEEEIVERMVEGAVAGARAER